MRMLNLVLFPDFLDIDFLGMKSVAGWKREGSSPSTKVCSLGVLHDLDTTQFRVLKNKLEEPQ